MEKGCECRCSAAFVAAIGIMMAANGGIQLATGIIFTFLVPLFLTGSNIGVGIVDLLFGLIITYLATSRLNCVREMKINLVLATVVGIINLGNLILMELGEWRFFDWTAHTTGIARQAPNLVQIAYYTTTLPSAIVLLLAVADLQYVGYSLAGYRKTPKAADNETTLKMHFSEESLNSCRGRSGHTPTSLFGWVFGDTEISSTKSNFSGEGMRSNSATSTRKLNADTMGLLYPDEGDTSSNESTPAERFATFSPRTTNWTLKPKGPIPTKQMKSLDPHDLETPPQGRNRQPQNVCFAPVKAKKLEEQISLVNHHNLNDTYTVSQQKCAVNCNSPYFRENPHKFLAAKLLAEAVCSSSRKTDPNCNNYNNNNNNEITPTHFKLRSEETSLPSTIARDHLFHISTPDISPTSKTLQEEFGPTDPESLVQLTRLELIARQWRLSAQHRDIHARVSHRLSKSKESD